MHIILWIQIIRILFFTTNVTATYNTSCARGRTICPAPVRRTLRPSSSPYTPYAAAPSAPCFHSSTCGHHEYSWCTRQTSDRQTDVRGQTASSLNAPA